MLNHITVMGRLTKDPELRYTQNNVPVVSFTVACDRDRSGGNGQQKVADFIQCVAWRAAAEFVSKYFFKGKMIVVDGSLQSRRWKDQHGNDRIDWEINADNVYFGDDKRRDDGYAQMDGGPQEYRNSVQQGPFEQSEDDGDLPF